MNVETLPLVAREAWFLPDESVFIGVIGDDQYGPKLWGDFNVMKAAQNLIR